MAIQPPSDILLDVAQNADSVREAAAIRRLESLAAGDATSGGFAASLDKLGSAQKLGGTGAAAALPAHRVSAKRLDRSAQAAQDFEASVLGSLLNEMMPKEAASVYGQGVAGDVWKSMLSDQIAHQLARSGALGLSRRLFATHPLESLHGRQALGSSAGEAAQRAVQSSPLPLSTPFSAGAASATARRS